MALAPAAKRAKVEEDKQELWNATYKALALDASACGEDLTCLAITMQLGYTVEMLGKTPKDGQQGIMCGCPPRHLELRPGMKTLDIGSGAGTDVILCGLQVQGHGGKAIGIDVLPEMVERAGKNAAATSGLEPGAAEFRLCDINKGELATHFGSGAFDVVTANCILCLFKQDEVFPKICDVLKPGGVFCFAEAMLRAPFPKDSAIYGLLREANRKGIYPAGRDAVSKAFRASVAAVLDDAMTFEEVKANLLRHGFAEVEKVADLNSPQGTLPKPFAMPKLRADGLSSTELADFQMRMATVWSSYDLDAHVHWVCTKARKKL